MKYSILLPLFCFCIFKCFHHAQGLPIVDKGVFVITGVKTCQGGLGYCILGNDCTVDKEFALDTLGGHCDGLRKAFTPRTFFTCCQYVDLNATTPTTTSTTTVRTTTVVTSDVSLESNETVESESVESGENVTETEITPGPSKPPISVITLDELMQNGTIIELDVEPTHKSTASPEKFESNIIETIVPAPAVVSPESASVVATSTDPNVETSSEPEVDESTVEHKPEVSPVQIQPEVAEPVESVTESQANVSQAEEPKPSKPPLEYVYHVDGDTKIIELKTTAAPTVQPVVVDESPEVTSDPLNDDDLEGNPEELGDDELAGIYVKEENRPITDAESQVIVKPEILDEYLACGIPQMKQKEIRVATADSSELNEQVGGDIGSCWLGGLVRSPTSLFSINDPGSYICSGALIGENTFLTSATCISRLVGNDLKLFRIILGTKHIIHPSNGVTYNGIYREIVNYKIHSNYSVIGQLRFHDIGVIQLKSRTLLEAFRQDEMQYCTLCLPRVATDFDKCIVSGYSHPSPSNGQDSDGIVHEAEQYIEASKYCESIINTQKTNYDYDGFTCASGVSNGEACFSPRDAGSPLACNLKNTSKYFIAGLFSSGFHCGTHDAPIIYTNIKHYLSWIYQNV